MEFFLLQNYFGFVILKGCHFDLEEYSMDITLIKCNGSPGVLAKLGEIPFSGARDTTEMSTAPKHIHLKW